MYQDDEIVAPACSATQTGAFLTVPLEAGPQNVYLLFSGRYPAPSPRLLPKGCPKLMADRPAAHGRCCGGSTIRSSCTVNHTVSADGGFGLAPRRAPARARWPHTRFPAARHHFPRTITHCPAAARHHSQGAHISHVRHARAHTCTETARARTRSA